MLGATGDTGEAAGVGEVREGTLSLLIGRGGTMTTHQRLVLHREVNF